MILRKPYGFLIRHFKFIHLLLFALSFYLTMKVNQILQFYNGFIRGSVSKLDAVSYITNYYIIVIVLSIAICLVVYALMRYKKKPRILYLLFILLYFLTGVMIQISYGGLHTIYISVLEVKTLLLYRDLLRILIVVQYLALIFLIIRGLGFDIKKFNFVKDLEELGEDVSDSEEVEFTVGGTEVAQRKIHRGIRELKYYYLENKAFIYLIIIVLLVIGISMFTVDKEVIHKVYGEKENFSSDNFNFQVVDSYITTRDSKGVMVGDLEHSFVAVRIMISSRVGEKVLEDANIILKTKSNSYSSGVRYANYFSDLGTVYQKQKISGNQLYVFLFSVSNSELSDEMKLIYSDDKVVLLKPVSLDEKSSTKSLNLGNELNLSDTVLGSGTLKFKSYELKDKFSYSYDYEVRGQKFKGEYSIQSGQGLILNVLMESNQLGMDNFSFLSNYATLGYTLDGKDYTSFFYDKTPGNYKDGVYLSVNKDLDKASRIWFSIQIRNKEYKYYLK